jgi:mannose-6-phosphate isomerase-like protein (cupin superfamily)
VRSGDAIENPVTGQRLTFLTMEPDVFRAEGWFPPGGFAGVEHVHPFQDEHFAVLGGEATFSVRGVEQVVGAGGAIDVPAGVRHTFRNAGSDAMEVRFEFRPGLSSTARFYELYFGFAQEGRVNAQALPGLIDIALIWPLVADHAVLARPHRRLQSALFWTLRPLAVASRRELPRCAVS